MTDSIICPQCGGELPERAPDIGGKQRIYCSSRCLHKAARARAKQERQRARDPYAPRIIQLGD